MKLVLWCQRQGGQVVAKADPRHAWSSQFLCPKSIEKELDIQLKPGMYFPLTIEAHLSDTEELIQIAKDKDLTDGEIHKYLYQIRESVLGEVMEKTSEAEQ